jgi:hypothetical protein
VNDYDDTLYLGVYVPGRWLIDLLRSCIDNYKRRLLTTRKLPADLFAEICKVPDEFDYLDENSIADERTYGPNVGR